MVVSNSIKLVYKKIDGVYRLNSNNDLLNNKFPFLSVCFANNSTMEVKHIEFSKFFSDGTSRNCIAWIDKHKNLIIRIFCPETQTSINF